MKKLLLSVISLSALANITSINNAPRDCTIENTEFTQTNDRLILENTFGEKSTKGKRFFDLSIQEIWTTKLKPFLNSSNFFALLLTAFTVIQVSRLSSIAQKMFYENNLFRRYDLYGYFDMNATLLMIPYALLTVVAIVDIVGNACSTKRA